MEKLVCGRYHATEKLGQGGMADVYSARHDMTNGEAAVKILNRTMSALPDIVKRFEQEAKAAAAVKHPGIIEIYDAGYTADGRAYIVMERLDGETLSARLRRLNVLTINAASTLMRQIAGVMHAAHSKGIVHRDLKPSNLYMVPDPDVPGGERVKVLDFGLAKLTLGCGSSLVTKSTSIFGTPTYMAPEQCKSAANVDSRADLYSIGCIFYRCLCGKPPFTGATPLQVMSDHINLEPIPPRQHRPDVPPHIDALIVRLLAKSPDHRVQNCSNVIAALDGLLDNGADTVVASSNETLVDAVAGSDGDTASTASPWRTTIVPEGAPDVPHARDDSAAVTLLAQPTSLGVSRGAPVPVHAPVAAIRPASGDIEVADGSSSINAGEFRGHVLRASTRPAPSRMPSTWLMVLAGAASMSAGLGLVGVWSLLDSGGDGPAADSPISAGEPDLSERRQPALSQPSESALSIEREGDGLAALYRALDNNAVNQVVKIFNGIPADAENRTIARAVIARNRPSLLQTVTRRAEKLIHIGQCAPLDAWIATVESVLPGLRTELRNTLQPCADGQSKPISQPAVPLSAPTPLTRTRADKLMAELKEAYARGDHHGAYKHCRALLAGDHHPDDARLWCTLAACRKKNPRQAGRHFRRLSESQQIQARQLCERDKVKFPAR